MNNVTLDEGKLKITVTGWDKIWSFKGSLALKIQSIKSVKPHDGKLKPPFWRCPGTAIPGMIVSGTYYGKNRKEFWNTHLNDTAIVIDLHDSEYTRIVIDVKNPQEVLDQIEQIIGGVV